MIEASWISKEKTKRTEIQVICPQLINVGGASGIPSPRGNKPITPDDVNGVD